MVKYVCGFLFDKTLNMVVLIEKLKPAWQKYCWNGVGGKIEDGETPLDAMIREFKEEASLEVKDWKPYCVLRSKNFEVGFFYSTMDAADMMEVKALTDEKLGIWSLAKVNMWSFPLLPNLRWILPMALVAAKENRKETFDIWVENPDNP